MADLITTQVPPPALLGLLSPQRWSSCGMQEGRKGQEQAHLEAGLVGCEVLGQDVLLLYIMVACRASHRVIVSPMTEER